MVKDPRVFKEVMISIINQDKFRKFKLMMNFITHLVCIFHDKNHELNYNLKLSSNMILMMMQLVSKNFWEMKITFLRKGRELISSSHRNKPVLVGHMILVMLKV